LEIAGRLGKPATSLGRPLKRLMEMGLVAREVPFGAMERKSKRTSYRIANPFLRLWFRFVAPNRSRLEARQIEPVERWIENGMEPPVAPGDARHGASHPAASGR